MANTRTQDVPDGRLGRSRSIRRKIVAAMLERVGERAALPGAEDVADRAGVGRRTVFRHFEDMDSLYAEIGNDIGRIVMHWRDKLHEMIDRRAPGKLLLIGEAGLGVWSRHLMMRV